MLKARDFRKRAVCAMNGKGGILALIGILYTLVTAATSYFSLFFMGPIMVGFAFVGITVIKGAEVRVTDLFSGFNYFVNNMVLYIVNSIFTALWSLLFVIPGIVKGLSYSMSYFIVAENPNIDWRDARHQSIEMMRGNKWRLFCLEFSFFGWMLLSVLSFGVLYIVYVAPYMQTAMAAFYEEIKPRPVYKFNGENNPYDYQDNTEHYFDVADFMNKAAEGDDNNT